jgi:hypothetical protein
MKKIVSWATRLTTAATLLFTTPAVVLAQYNYDLSELEELSRSFGTDYYGTAAAGVAAGTVAIFCCIFLFYFGFGILMAYFVHKDATKHGVENPMLWVVLAFVFSLSGGLAYFVFRDANQRKMENAALWAVACFFLSVLGVVLYLYHAPSPSAAKEK